MDDTQSATDQYDHFIISKQGSYLKNSTPTNGGKSDIVNKDLKIVQAWDKVKSLRRQY